MQKERKNMPLAQPAKRQQDSGNKMFRITSALEAKPATEISKVKASGCCWDKKKMLSAVTKQAGNLCKARELRCKKTLLSE